MLAQASELDSTDEQTCRSDEFLLPTNNDLGADGVPPDRAVLACTYLCGNSLGALPKRSAEAVKEELNVWGTRAVDAHFTHPLGRPWKRIADTVHPLLADILGAHENEVACMGTLTANLHLLMNTFYKPTRGRYKILCESHAFPSDQYAFASQVSMHGLDRQDAVIELHPRTGEHALRDTDILDTIKREGQSIALVLFSGVQFYTGQWFAMEAITKAAHEQGCICGWDLAHAVGNIPMSLHDWGVDFAVWCSYKYLNAGPGGIAGLFIHEKWDDIEKPRMAGWWGHDPHTRFEMPPEFSPIRGAQGYQQSNPCVFAVVSLLGALQVFQEAGGIYKLRAKSIRLTGYLEKLLRESQYFREVGLGATEPNVSEDPWFTIITPAAPDARGAQLSLLFFPPQSGTMQVIFDGLEKRGIKGDHRPPDVIRLAPHPLYNTFQDCWRAAEALNQAFEEIKAGITDDLRPNKYDM